MTLIHPLLESANTSLQNLQIDNTHLRDRVERLEIVVDEYKRMVRRILDLPFGRKLLTFLSND